MRIVLGADHAGYDLKELLRGDLEGRGYEVTDVGTDSPDRPDDYPDFAAAVGVAIQAGRAERGVLICGSGVGASVAANKLPGIRAAVCHDAYSARQGVEHDDLNVLVLGARVVGRELARDLVRAFLSARFTGEDRHARRLAKIRALEAHPPRPGQPDDELPGYVGHMTARLPADLATAVDATTDDWRTADKVRRLWFKDPGLWTGQDEGNWLGWLNVPNEQLADLDHLSRFAADVRGRQFTHVLLLGMGGSSLCPEVLAKTFGRRPGWPELVVLGSTDPRQVAAAERRVALPTTLVIVASKSGSTLEPTILKDYFHDRMAAAVGPENTGDHFAAITDPGSPFEKAAREAGFRWVFHGVKSIGGRYSALSDFGMIPAAAMGLDVARLLGTAAGMANACAAPVPPADNPGVALGLILGEASRRGRDKLTLLASPGLRSVGPWLEQLLAESTGKQGKGIIPIDREPVGPPSVYGTDRLFAYLKLAGEGDGDQERAVEALERAGQPVIRVVLPDRYDLGAEFFRWEFATAVAGAVLGINPFDQPDVEASKVETRKLVAEYEKAGTLPAEQPLWTGEGVALYADPRNAAELAGRAADGGSLRGFLAAHLGRLKPGDYFAVLAYLPMTAEHERLIDEARVLVRDGYRVATCGEFGPRFLHSTGQAYKGGPNTGVFLQLTCDEPADLSVPGKRYTFGAVKAAQARGDFQVLAERGRRALRVHLGGDVAAGLASLRDAIRAATV